MKDQIREIISQLILLVRKHIRHRGKEDYQQVVDLNQDFSESEDLEIRKYLMNLSSEAIQYIVSIMCVGRDYCVCPPEGNTSINLEQALKKYVIVNKEIGIEQILDKEDICNYLEKGLTKLKL